MSNALNVLLLLSLRNYNYWNNTKQYNFNCTKKWSLCRNARPPMFSAIPTIVWPINNATVTYQCC